MGSIPGAPYPRSQATLQLSPDCQGTLDVIIVQRKQHYVVECQLTLYRQATLRPCDQAWARLSPAGVDRVSLPVPGTEDRR